MPQVALQSKLRFREAWGGDATFATTLLNMLVDTYGTEAFEWDAETLKMEIEEDFDVVMPRANMDRLMTAIAIQTTDDFFNSLPDFVNFCNILDGDLYEPTQWDPADPMEMAWGITEAMLIYPPDVEDPFSEEILEYMGAMLKEFGIITPPDVLRIAAYDHDLAPRIHAEFSDDPEMFSGIFGFEKQKTDEINAGVKERLMRLAVQLDGIPLSNGSAKDAVKRTLASLH